MLQSDIICLNEINLGPNKDAPILPEYTAYYLNSRNNSGVAIYIKSSASKILESR